MKSYIHQRYVTAPMPEPLNAPPVNCTLGYLRPAAGNRILIGVGTPDWNETPVTDTNFNMSQLSVPSEVRDMGVYKLMDFLPILKIVTWESEHIGMLSFSLDGEPILGPVDQCPGLFVGGAFHSGGFSYNTVAGLLLAEHVADGRTSIDVRSFSPNRFTEQREIDKYFATTMTQREMHSRRH